MMKIKTTKEIAEFHNKYNSKDTKLFMKWVAVDDLEPVREMLGHMSKNEMMVQCFQDKKQVKKVTEIYYTLTKTQHITKSDSKEVKVIK